jgi:hypothetical protein
MLSYLKVLQLEDHTIRLRADLGTLQYLNYMENFHQKTSLVKHSCQYHYHMHTSAFMPKSDQ